MGVLVVVAILSLQAGAADLQGAAVQVVGAVAVAGQVEVGAGADAKYAAGLRDGAVTGARVAVVGGGTTVGLERVFRAVADDESDGGADLSLGGRLDGGQLDQSSGDVHLPGGGAGGGDRIVEADRNQGGAVRGGGTSVGKLQRAAADRVGAVAAVDAEVEGADRRE